MEKFMRNFYKNLKIKNKLFVILLAETLILSLLSIIALQISFYIYDEQLYNQAVEVLNLWSTNVENKLKQVSKLSYNIISNMEVQQYLMTIKNDPSMYNKVVAGDKLDDKLLAWALSEKYIFSIQVIDTNGNRYEGGIDSLKIDKARLNDIVDKASRAEGKDLWIEPYGQDKAIISTRVVRAIPELSLESLGTLIIIINPEKLIDKSSSLSSRYDPDIVILSGDNIIFEGYKAFPIKRLLLPKGREQGYLITQVDGKKYLIAYTTSDYTNWTYLNVIPYKAISKQTSNIRIIMTVLFLCIFIVIQYLGVNFARGITKPLERLTEEMKKVENGNFEEIQNVNLTSSNRKDEVESLEYDFRLMVDKINTLINENYTKQIMIKESELKALHAQINPHFLYNTLDSINWQAKLNKQYEIATMVKSLGNLLRNSISKKDYVITIEEETRLLEDYIAIQKIRYEERLEFKMTIDEGLNEYMIPKLTLQPIVENSINYGLEQLPEVCKINICTHLYPDKLEITVEDNGPGMDDEFLEKLRKGEINPRGSGIGLKNINERIKILFGEQYGLCINSKVNEGTRVSIYLPYKKEVC
jgi:two-component system sensor histidine kinase YesM